MNFYCDIIDNNDCLNFEDNFISFEYSCKCNDIKNYSDELSIDNIPCNMLNTLSYDKKASPLKSKEDKNQNILDNVYFIEKINWNNEDKNKNNIDPINNQYTFDKIKKEIFPKYKYKIFKIFNGNLLMDKHLLSLEKIMFLKKKRRKKKGKIKYIEDDDESTKVGRKKKDDFTKRKHNIFSGDNIIRKIKIKFFEYMRIFLNKVLNSYYVKFKKDDIIKSLSFQYINIMKKELELSLLNKTLKEIFSNEISRKYKALPRDYNKQIIDTILYEEKDNINIIFAFNLTFREWIDIFTYKKDIQSIKNFDSEKMKELPKLIDYVDKLLLDMYNKYYYNRNYLIYFIFYIYNYERWFAVKIGRKSASEKKNLSV